MRSPCNQCLVRAMCVKDCDIYLKFVNFISTIILIMTMFTFGILVLLLVYFFKNIEWKYIITFLVIGWGPAFFYSMYICDKNNIEVYSIFLLVAAPYIFISIILTIIFQWYTKHINRLKL